MLMFCPVCANVLVVEEGHAPVVVRPPDDVDVAGEGFAGLGLVAPGPFAHGPVGPTSSGRVGRIGFHLRPNGRERDHARAARSTRDSGRGRARASERPRSPARRSPEQSGRTPYRPRDTR